jgi:hypothetical protein
MTTLPISLPHPDDPPPLPAWECHCGKRSVGVCCWNCGQGRPVERATGHDVGDGPESRTGAPTAD